MKTNKQVKRKVLLKGEGLNCHVLEGNYVEGKDGFLVEEAVIKHETPSGEMAEHKTLRLEKGPYLMGRQVEYNPFSSTISRVWD